MNHIQKYIFTGLILLSGLTGCSKAEVEPVASGGNSIGLSGVLTRSGEAALKHSNLYLTAFPVGDKGIEADKYYINNLGINEIALSTTSQSLTFKDPIAYPLEKKIIAFFAHSGERQVGNIIKIESGKDSSKDYLISNGESGNIGKGTHGDSQNKATLLTFRHIMTKVDVQIIIDNADFGSVPDVPVPEDIKIEMNKALVAPEGTFGLLSNSVTVQDAGSYVLKNGTNYLIPTGKTLSGKDVKAITDLVIHDYKASSDDLKALVIPKAIKDGVESNFTLNPGEAYELTFTVKRLKVASITIKKVNWEAKEINSNDILYNSKGIALSAGVYTATDLSKIVLYDIKDRSGIKDTITYVGSISVKAGSLVGNFATLPNLSSSNKIKVDLYTSEGLLLEDVDARYNEAKLDLGKFSENGMLPVDPANEYDALGNPYAITTAVQFKKAITGTRAFSYKLMNNIDMAALFTDDPVTASTPLDFPGGAIFDGDGKYILNLNLEGDGLFKENKGTLKNIRIASGTITSTGIIAGGLCATNSGVIEGCINQAEIKGSAATIGGICGINNIGATLLACLNTGNIGVGTTVGGICGEDRNTSGVPIQACINTGMLNKAATNLGGICGIASTPTAADKILNTCYWLTGTARKVQSDYTSEKPIGDQSYSFVPADNISDLNPTSLRSGTIINKLNAVAGNWEFVYSSTSNVYECVWPLPTKK